VRARPQLVAALLITAGCLDREPTASSDGPGPVPEVIPSAAWIEVGDRIRLDVVPESPFSASLDDERVARLEQNEVIGLAPGAARAQLFFPRGRGEARINVRASLADRRAAILGEGLSDASLLGVWSADAATTFAVGTLGTILVTRDGGATWSRMDSGITADLVGIWGSSPTNVFAAGARGAMVHYDGNSWRKLPVLTTDALLEVCGLDSTHV